MSNQNNYPETVEVTLPSILFSVVKNRKSIWISILVFAILLGGVRLALGLVSMNNEESFEQAQADYTVAMNLYTSSKETMETQMAELQSEIDRQRTLKESAELLRIDPYHTYTGHLTYYIDTGYEVSPELSFQTPDYTESLIKAYSDIVLKENLNAILSECLERDIYSLNPVTVGDKIPEQVTNKQIVTIEKKAEELSEGVIRIVIIGESEEVVKFISKTLIGDIEANTPMLQTTIGEHAMTLLSENCQEGGDADLLKLRQIFDNNLQELIEELQDIVEDYAKLEKPKEVLSNTSVIIGTILFIVIGAILGFIFSVIWLVIKAVAQDRLTDARELVRRYGLQVLGTITEKDTKPHWLEKKICESMGISSDLTKEENVALAGAKIDLYSDKGSVIWLTGNISSDRLEKIAEDIQETVGEHQIRVLGNVFDSAEAIHLLRNNGPVVCVTELYQSSHQKIRQMLLIIKKANKELIGFLLLR